jgi:hypothetical protein
MIAAPAMAAASPIKISLRLPSREENIPVTKRPMVMLAKKAEAQPAATAGDTPRAEEK